MALVLGALVVGGMIVGGTVAGSQPEPYRQASGGVSITTAVPPPTSSLSYSQQLAQRQSDVLSSIQRSLAQESSNLEAEANAAPRTFVGDGTWEVGDEAGQMPPGRWRTLGGPSCYWQRNSDASGSYGSILANGFAEGTTVVDIPASGDTFYAQGDCTWSKR